MEWNLGSFRQPIQKVILGLVRYPRPEGVHCLGFSGRRSTSAQLFHDSRESAP